MTGSKQFKPQRGRPTAAQVAAIDAAIITTARRHFLESGFDAVAMEAIAGELGISKGTLYGRYSSKEALFHAIVQESVGRWASEHNGEPAGGSGIADRLHHHARTIIRSQVNPEVQAFQRLIFATADRFPELARSMHDVGLLRIVDAIADDILRAGIQDGREARDPTDIAYRMVATLTGWYLQQRLIRSVSEEEFLAFGRRTADLLLTARDLW